MLDLSERLDARFLKRLMLRSELAEEDRLAVLALPGRVRHVARGQELVIPDRAVSHATLVIEGVVGRFDQMADGRRQITALYMPGDMSDLHSVPMPLPAWGIEALSQATVMLVPHDDLRRLAGARPAVGLAFWRDTVADASVLAKWAANLGRSDAVTRMAHLICEVGVRMEAMELGDRRSFAFPVTQAQLADALGLTTVHVNRTLMALKKTCELTMSGGVVRVIDWDCLAELASFDDNYLLIGR